MEDTVVFQAGNIHISRTAVRIGEVSYPTNSIRNVFIVAPQPLGWIAAALLALLAAIGLFGVPHFEGVASLVLLAGAGLFGVAFVLPYRLMFNTDGNETQALTSRDRDFLADIKKAIEIAVTMPV